MSWKQYWFLLGVLASLQLTQIVSLSGLQTDRTVALEVAQTPVASPELAISSPEKLCNDSSEFDERAFMRRLEILVTDKLENAFQRFSDSLYAQAMQSDVTDSELMEENNTELFSETISILNHAISRGSWTREDFDATLPVVSTLSAGQREELALKFADAVNAGKINLDEIDMAMFPPF
jgi:hypothetical protein